MNRFCFLFAAVAVVLVTSLGSAASAGTWSKDSQSPVLEFSGESIQAISKTHFRVKVAYSEAAKMRCVGFAEKQAVAIDSIVVIPPFGVANMLINETDKDIDGVKCWITSTRKEDLKRDYIQHDLN
ncbi:hypothetical protein swp_1730 [Shewanella piezotolerans WP3]|uniref:Uncharacterized protein n=1 Tax=Shewanella piezotolerans (strain WP3 / JCM 13877) TaxID=225849 RepID=B8CMZ9_SHEPW|nr:hypothetical protein [Shewanella piezotolerans]ACJ28501.1 hypothetical protein swp_1730 [Shewanella piezotolerans WP3]